MQNLKSLVLRGCRNLKTLSDDFGNLLNLEILDLYACNKISVLPGLIKKMQSLKTLDLSYCDKLLQFPSEVETIKNLKIIKTPLSNRNGSKKDNTHILQPDSNDYDIGVRSYQERIDNQNQLDFSRSTTKIIDNYINQGVIPKEAKVLAHFSVLSDVEFSKAEIFTDLDEDTDDMHPLFDLKLNSNGHVIELHVPFMEEKYLTLIPKMLCSLEQLEVIRFPNNSIMDIPEWISNLKFLRVLDVSNAGRPNQDVPDSVKSFIESLESYNQFYYK